MAHPDPPLTARAHARMIRGMTDFLPSALARPGRKKQQISASVARELTEGDLELFRSERGEQPGPIKALRAKHHKLAQALASGLSQTEAAYMCGFTPSRVSILRADPMFGELEAHYRNIENAAFRETRERLADFAADAIDTLHERLLEDPDDWTKAELMQAIPLAADRSGNGPSQKTEVDIKVGLADRLEAARRRAESRTIEGTAKDITE